jgi:hypothetical protein
VVALALVAVVWTGCAHRPVERPASITIACGDGNFYVTALHWKRWAATDAVATGTGHQNDCKPYCAAGHFHTFPLTVRLSRVVQCVPRRREFLRIAWDGVRLTGIPKAGSERLPCSFLKLRP